MLTVWSWKETDEKGEHLAWNIMSTITTSSFFLIDAFSATSQTFGIYQSNLCQLEQKTSAPSYLRSMLLQSF